MAFLGRPPPPGEDLVVPPRISLAIHVSLAIEILWLASAQRPPRQPFACFAVSAVAGKPKSIAAESSCFSPALPQPAYQAPSRRPPPGSQVEFNHRTSRTRRL